VVDPSSDFENFVGSFVPGFLVLMCVGLALGDLHFCRNVHLFGNFGADAVSR
jgi:hypothetical protein